MILEFSYRFEAAHRFLNSASVPCMTPHGHTWYATLGIEFLGNQLNRNEMTQEFTQLKKQWKTLVTDVLDHSYLHNINDPIVEVLKSETKAPRLLPFPNDPTTEAISLFLFNKMDLVFSQSDKSETFRVSFIKIQETPTNSLHCTRDFFLSQKESIYKNAGWWTETDIESRSYYGSND